MHTNRSVLEIDTPAADVWADLVELSTWGTWNPTIHKVDGALRRGANVTIRVGTRAAPRTWTCTIARHVEGSEFSWTFRGRSARLFRGEHVFRVEPLDEHRTRFVDQEDWWGLLALLRRRELKRLRAGMEHMDDAFKRYAERERSQPSV